jgi:hypothetical protein
MSAKRTKRKEWVHYLPPVVLKNILESWPNYMPMSAGRIGTHGPGAKLAYTLYMAGAKTFNFTHSWLSGDESRPENLMVHTNSVMVTPYIKCPLPKYKDRPLLWYLMEKSPWGFCGGGAGEDGNYMQAGTKHSAYKDLNLEAELLKAVMLFQHFIQNFPR